MKLSVNWIKEYTTVDLSNEDLVKKIGSQLGEVEEAVDLSSLYKNIYIVKVVDCVQHPKADKLSLCKIDDGGKAPDVSRDNNGMVQVVCGAPNVKSGMLAVWLPPGTTVPATYGKDPLILEQKEIRGQVSNGMLASPKELGISESHDGILEIQDSAQIGQLFADFFELNDTIIDIENKMLTHRPDLFGELGLAREVAGITGRKFKSPDWYLKPKELNLTKGSTSLEAKNEIPDSVNRFMAQVINGVTVKPSSPKIQSYLNRVGLRPINNIVDFTNYYMMLTAQPLHAYDLDKLKKLDGSDKAALIVRKPKENEELTLLNGKTVKLLDSDILIASRNHPIGLGGVMGGADVEVDGNTKNIAVECANFDMYTIRRTAMAHGVFSDAVTRFNKGQSPLQNDKILAAIVGSIIEDAGGEAEAPIDIQSTLPKQVELKVSPSFINGHLGIEIDPEKMAELLRNVEFDVEVSGDELKIKVPFWRTDIAISEDVVEEVGRLFGYDNLRLELPTKSIKPAAQDDVFNFKSELRDILARAGLNELLTYNFTSEQLFEKVGQDKNLAYKLSNPLSPELGYYRMSLLPSLLEKVHPNIKAGYQEFGLFEMNKVHLKNNQDKDEPELPAEPYRLGVVLAADEKLAKTGYSGAPYYQARYYLDYLMYTLGIKYEIKVFSEPDNDVDRQMVKPFEQIRTGFVYIDNELVGVIGEPSVTVRNSLKLPKHSSMIELDLLKLLSRAKTVNYSKLSNYPFSEQDVTFKLPASVSYQELYDLISSELEKLTQNSHVVLTPLDVFQKEEDQTNKHITFRLHISSYERTLKSGEVNDLIASLGKVAKDKFGAEII